MLKTLQIRCEDLLSCGEHFDAYNGCMFVQPRYRRKNGKHHAYWALVESYLTALGPRQHTVTYLGHLSLVYPSSELHIAKHYYPSTALPDLLGIPADKIYDKRLYLTLDQLLPHKEGLKTRLKERLCHVCDLKYDLLLYDVTSTYFEGQCQANPLIQRGHSCDQRTDCKQGCIGLVVSKCGMPLGYEVFEGIRNDGKTWQAIVLTMEGRYGKADRIWCGDRGMMSRENPEFMQTGGRQYIMGGSKATLKRFERELLDSDRRHIREDLEVKLCPSPDNGEELVILYGSQDTGRRKGDAPAF